MRNQRMKIHDGAGRLLVICLLCLVCGLGAGTLQAQNSLQKQKPAKGSVSAFNKVAVQFEGTNIMAQAGAEGPGAQDLVSAQIRTVETNDLLIDIGMQIRLQTTSTPGSDAFALLDVRVYLDGSIISPGVVRYLDQRAFQSPGEPENSFSLERLAAVSFSFVTTDLSPGVHTILAKAYLPTSAVGGGAATGSVGVGTMTIETVHVIRDSSDIPTLQ